MELEVGMYVRTKYGIAKIIQTNFKDENEEDVLIVDKKLEFGYVGCNDEHLCDINDILKARYRIIELLEVGDYVNGYPVRSINSNEKIVYEIEVKRPNDRAGVWIERLRNDEDIKSIVTKEQFESMSYKVGD